MQRTSIGPRKAGGGGGGGSAASPTGAAARPPYPSSFTFASAAAKAGGGKISHGILSLALVQERIELVLSNFFEGLSDSLALTRTWTFWSSSEMVRENAGKCFLLNSGLLLGSHLLYSRLLSPFLLLVGRCIYTYLLPFLLSEREGGKEGGGMDGWEEPPAKVEALVSVGCYMVYQIAWMWPVFLLAFVVSIGLNDAVAEAAYLHRRARGPAEATEIPRLVGDLVSRLVTVYALLLHSLLLLLFPPFLLLLPPISFPPSLLILLLPLKWLCQLWGLLLTCWLDSFYAFQYVWARQGKAVAEQTRMIERNWSYFLGFGFLPALLSFHTPLFVGAGSYASVFPMYILLALQSKRLLIVPSKGGREGEGEGGEEEEEESLPMGRAPVFWFARRVERAVIRQVSAFLDHPLTPVKRREGGREGGRAGGRGRHGKR